MEKDHLEDLGVNRRILKWIIKNVWYEGVNWIKLVWDKVQWGAIVNAVISFRVPQNISLKYNHSDVTKDWKGVAGGNIKGNYLHDEFHERYPLRSKDIIHNTLRCIGPCSFSERLLPLTWDGPYCVLQPHWLETGRIVCYSRIWVER
jgi:hypothetical protein